MTKVSHGRFTPSSGSPPPIEGTPMSAGSLDAAKLFADIAV